MLKIETPNFILIVKDEKDNWLVELQKALVASMRWAADCPGLYTNDNFNQYTLAQFLEQLIVDKNAA